VRNFLRQVHRFNRMNMDCVVISGEMFCYHRSPAFAPVFRKSSGLINPEIYLTVTIRKPPVITPKHKDQFSLRVQ